MPLKTDFLSLFHRQRIIHLTHWKREAYSSAPLLAGPRHSRGQDSFLHVGTSVPHLCAFLSDTRMGRSHEASCLLFQFSGTPKPFRSQGDSGKAESKGHNIQVLASTVSSLCRNRNKISEALHFHIMLLLCLFLRQVYTNHRTLIPFLNKMRDCLVLGLTLAASVKLRCL